MISYLISDILFLLRVELRPAEGVSARRESIGIPAWTVGQDLDSLSKRDTA